MAKNHWVYMNGSLGCVADTMEVCRTKRDAIEMARTIFQDLPRGMVSDLKKQEIHYFVDPCEAGAGYASIGSCNCTTPWDHTEFGATPAGRREVCKYLGIECDDIQS